MVSLRKIIESLRSDRDEDVYISKSKSELIIIDGNSNEAEEFFSDLQINNDNYLYLSKSCGINLKECIIEFVSDIDNDEIKHELSIDYSYELFMDGLFHFGLRDAWNEFMDNKYYEFIIAFFKRHNIEYVDDANGKHEYVIKVTKTYVKNISIYARTKEDALEMIELMDNENQLDITEENLLEGVFEVEKENE